MSPMSVLSSFFIEATTQFKQLQNSHVVMITAVADFSYGPIF